MPHKPARIAVVGSGVAGLTAAYVASLSAEVTLFEADDRLGGHADTHDVTDPATGRSLAIDTGFIVHNAKTYPVLSRLFAELDVATQESEMSMSIRDDGTGLEWAGALGRRGIFPTAANLVNPRYLWMLTEIPRFHRRAHRLLDADPSETFGRVDGETLREFVSRGRFSAYFVRHFMEPLVAAVWSCDPEVALDYPARYLFTFLEHHGMLGVFGSPQWRTVSGGSREYVERVAARLQSRGAGIRLGTKVTSVQETESGVEVTDGNGEVTTYDGLVIATHPGQALGLLAEPTSLQREVLGAMPYSPNTALLHTDTSVLPRASNAWASWNFTRPAEARGDVTVTYDLTRLQRLDTDTHFLVTLGGEHLVDADLVIDRMEYEHPLYNPTSVAAQSRLPELNTSRIAFAGAYHGWGFHEDGARSGLTAAEHLGLSWDATPGRLAAPPVTGIYETTIRHTRRTPMKRTFTHHSHTWVVDLDELPDHGVLGRFEARDHLGDPDRSIRENISTFLQEQSPAADGIDLEGGRVLMAAQARAFGFCFNPISVFWCWDRAGELAATVVEVHNTYGDRHAYLVHPDEQGRATTPKAMYVSPFHGTDGYYELAVAPPAETPDGGNLDLVVTLHTDHGAPFTAALGGHQTNSSPLRAAPAALRGAALIRMHGIWLWLRRLPVVPRPKGVPR